jgi:hypothetical protein
MQTRLSVSNRLLEYPPHCIGRNSIGGIGLENLQARTADPKMLFSHPVRTGCAGALLNTWIGCSGSLIRAAPLDHDVLS